MNIMKTNMLLMNNKIMKDDAGNTTTTTPVPSTIEPQKGMKALSFLGMKNLMANPKLAQGVGVMNDKVAEKSSADSYVAPFSSNMAFKGGMQKTAKVATLVALAAMATASLQSCKHDDTIIQETTVIVDTEALAAAITNGIAALQAEINALKAQLAQQSAEQAARDQKIIDALLQAIAQLQDINGKLDKQSISFEEFKLMIYGQNSAILDAIVLLQNITKEEAKAQVDRILEAFRNGLIDIKTAMAQIQELLKTNNELLGDILATLKDLKAAADKANEQRDVLIGQTNEIIKYNKASVYQQQMMVQQLGTLIYQNGVQIQNQIATIKAIKETGADLKASIYDVANQLGVKIDDLAEVIMITGKSLEEVMTMSKEEILAVLEANLAELQETNNRLNNVNNNLNNINLNVEDNTGAIVNAANEINDILNKISGQLDALSAQLAAQYKTYTAQLNTLIRYAASTNWNTAMLNMQFKALLTEVSGLKRVAVQIRNNLKDGVAVDMNQLEEFFKILNMHQTESKNEIIAKLDEFIAKQDNTENAINNLGDKLDIIASLVKNKTNDNSDVIEAINNLSKANEENIAAATEQLAAKLDALIAKADAILDKMDDIIPILKQYGDQMLAKLDVAEDILAAIKANGAKLDIANMSLSQLQAEVEKIKPELQKLNNSATTANGYLDIIAKRQLEIKEAINNLEAIGGGGITKDELEELWKAHDANAFATAKAYLDGLHAEDMDKADEIISYLKKGNQTAGDIYQLLLDGINKAGNDSEKLRKLLQAVYDYLPELICKCNCQGNCNQNNSTHEGIIDIIS